MDLMIYIDINHVKLDVLFWEYYSNEQQKIKIFTILRKNLNFTH